VAVAAGGFVVLPDGDYGAVSVGQGGTLILSGGTYNLRSLSGDTGSQLLFAAPAEVRVEERLLTAPEAVLGPAPGAAVAPHDLVIYVAGINGLDGGLLSSPLAAEIGSGNRVALSLYVPDGTLRVGHATLATGAFLGRDVLVETQARLVLDSYFFNRAPIALGDSATVGAGGTVSVLDSGALSLIDNDSDPNGDPLTVSPTPVSGPAHGTLVLAANGTFSYTHDGSDTTGDSFVYQVCDDASPALCATATVTIAVARRIRVEVRVFGLGSGRVVSSPAGIDCGSTCTAFFDGTEDIQLAAEPLGTSVFGGFGGDVDCADGQLTPDGDKLCTARFDASAAPAQLSVDFAGSGSGRVVSTPAGIDCPAVCSAGFPIPTRVELAAVADTGSSFVGWSGDPGCAGGEVALFADTHCVAVFDLVPPPPPSFTLTLIFLGGGTGTVTSNPAGVLCESGCAVSFARNTALTLFARPLEGTFRGWGGDCTGSDVSTSLLLDADKTCTVAFDP
jgi:VCBS repeat-containing protein